MFDDARRVEALGFAGLVVEETKDGKFQLLALAAQATQSLRLGTSVAIAFPRSPYVRLGVCVASARGHQPAVSMSREISAHA